VIRFQVGGTGTREGATRAQLDSFRETLVDLGITDYHHGVCVGFDADSHRAAREVGGIWIIGHPPVRTDLMANLDLDEVRGPRPYLDRDRQIVLEADLLIACPRGREEELRSGTWATVRIARRLRRPHILIYPDGELDLSGC
jgi:hypothetical protein